MTDFNGFHGAAKRLEDMDIPRIGHQIGVGEDEVHAVLDVEAAGSGFDANGRPKMLFEPHVFYRNLKGDARKRAVSEGLAYAKWKRSYPKDSYPRLERALLIDETAALKAASWGLGQILGENYSNAGYSSVQAMVKAFMADEENHLDAMIKFIKKTGIDDDLQAHRWASFAKGYNGSGYKANKYDEKLRKAYAKWTKIRDTAYVVPAPPPSSLPPLAERETNVVTTELVKTPGNEPDIVKAATETKTETPIAPSPVTSLPVDENTAKRVQSLLKEKGYYETMVADGDVAGRTQGAILAFKNEAGLKPLNPDITPELITALENAPHRYVPPKRANVTKKELMKDPGSSVAEPLKKTFWQKVAAWIIGAPAGAVTLANGASDQVSVVKEKLEPVSDFFSSIPLWSYGLIVVVLAVVLYLASRQIDNKLVDMSRRGEVA